jgi:hypothetical protein
VRAKVHNEPSSIGFTALRQDFKELRLRSPRAGQS